MFTLKMRLRIVMGQKRIADVGQRSCYIWQDSAFMENN